MFRRRRITPSVGPFRANFEEQIIQAQTLFQQEHFAAAAAIFEKLAGEADARGGPRAPRFFIQAGRSWLHARNITRGMPLLERGWNLALQSGRQAFLGRKGPLLVTEFIGLGLVQESNTVSAWLGKIPVLPDSPRAGPQKHPSLPLKCPSCGASVIPNQVDWLDEVTAECDFCGSLLRGS
jgi:hypothetical protein